MYRENQKQCEFCRVFDQSVFEGQCLKFSPIIQCYSSFPGSDGPKLNWLCSFERC